MNSISITNRLNLRKVIEDYFDKVIRRKKYFYKYLFRKTLKNIIRGEQIISHNIENENFDKQLFWLSSRRFISHAKSIICLCNKKQNLEALMLLRPIIELVVNLRWLIEDKTGINHQQFMKSTEYKFNNSIPEMGDYWAEKNLLERMKAIGFSQNYYDTVIRKLHEELHGNPAVIARAHYRSLTSMNSEAIFSLACQFAGHLLKVANELYSDEYFINYNDVWNKIKVSMTKEK